MNYIVLDLEWNQPFSMKHTKRSPIFLRGEIIEIGAVKLDENYHIRDTFKIMVTPKFYTRMNKKVTKITKITTAELQYGFPFEIAFRHFSKWCGDDFIFLTWGPDDIGMLRDNMIVNNIDIEWLPKSYNLQIIFDNQITKENRQISLTDAMEKVGEVGRDAHDALNDAHNTAHICLHLDMAKGLSDYAELIKKPSQVFSDAVEAHRIAGEYDTPVEALENSIKMEIYCPFCGEKVEYGEIARQGQDRFICIGKCPNDEQVFVRFRARKRANEKYAMSCIVYEISEERQEYYNRIKKKREDMKRRYLETIANAV